MGKIEEVKVPDIGDFDEVDVVEVLVSPGDRVEREGSLITLESDKATMEVPSPYAGEVREVKVERGSKVSQGDLILTLEVEEGAEPAEPTEPIELGEGAAGGGEKGEEASGEVDAEAAAAPPPRAARPEEGPREREQRAAPAAPAEPAAPTERAESGGPVDQEAFRQAHASPAVRRFARQLGVDLSEVEGSGREGRITREDVEAHVKQALSQPVRGAAGLALPEMPEIDFSRFGEVERQPLSRIRKVGAANLHRAWLHVPHVTQFDEADITELEAFRQAHAAEAAERGFKLTLLAFLVKAVVAALQELPRFNSSLDRDGETLIVKKYFHIGIAVDTPDGLVVPVLRDADRKGLFALAEELAELARRAREKKLRPEDLQGASFSISSLGGIGGTAFTPIVNAPEVAILGVSRAQRKPVFRDGELAARLMLPLSLSYDHRVVDGAAGARFTTFLVRVLSDLRTLLL